MTAPFPIPSPGRGTSKPTSIRGQIETVVVAPTDVAVDRPAKLDGMATPIETVEAFCRAWEDIDIDALALYFTDDAVYHNMPMDPIVGRDAIVEIIRSFTAGSQRIEFEIVNIAADGPTVLTERIDRFFLPDRTIVLPVMGTFEIADGHIAAWRDYFDLGQYTQQLR